MTTLSPQAATGALTVLVTRRAAPGHEAAFEHVMGRMIEAARETAGHLGGQLVRPGQDGNDPGLYHIVFAFDTAAHLAAWQDSPRRAQLLQELAPHTCGPSEMRQVSGLAHWFAEPQGPPQAPPPRWKVAVATWLGIFPTVLTLFLTVAPFMANWPLVLRTAVLTALVVLLMTWVVAPQITRRLRHWLHAA